MAEASTESAPAKESVRVGITLGGHYKLLRLLGEGGAGRVFEALNASTGRHVALKVLRPEFSSQPAIVRRFRREAVASGQIEHPNVVDVLDMGEDSGTFFIVQEMLAGIDLRTWLERRGKLPLRESLEILVPVMSALIAAHRKGIIHRDVKPENIFLVRNAAGAIVPKLIDFGVAKLMVRDSKGPVTSRTTLAGTVFGTPAYMSPEQARGTVVLDERTDVWSVGAVLYELLSGRAPFDAASHNLLMVKIITEPVPRIETLVEGLSADVCEILHKALDPVLDTRFRTVRHLLSALLESATYHHRPDGAASVDPHVFEELAPISRDANHEETTRLPRPAWAGIKLSPFTQGALGAFVVSLSMFAAHRLFSEAPVSAAPIRAGMPVTVVPPTPLCPESHPRGALYVLPVAHPVTPEALSQRVEPAPRVFVRRSASPQRPSGPMNPPRVSPPRVSSPPRPTAPHPRSLGGFSHAGPLSPASSYPE